MIAFRSPLPFFFFNDTAPPEIYPLSLPDALPISGDHIGEISLLAPQLAVLVRSEHGKTAKGVEPPHVRRARVGGLCRDRKSTRLNSSHGYISYAVFCLKKKKRTLVLSMYLSTHVR